MINEFKDTYIVTQIKRTNRNMAVASAILILGILSCFLLEKRYFYNFFKGPFPITAQELAQLQDPSDLQNYFVRLSVRQFLDAGYYEVNTKTNETTAYFFVATVSDETNASVPLLVKLDGRDPQAKGYASTLKIMRHPVILQGQEQWFEGYLVKPPEDPWQHVLAAMPETFSGRSPVMLNTLSFRQDGYFWLAMGGSLIGLGFLGIIVALRRRNLVSHPLARALARVGDFESMVMQVENEMQRNQEMKVFPTRFKKYFLKMTKNWVFLEYLIGVRVAFLGDVMWVYERIVNRSAHFVQLYTRFGKVIEISCNSDQVKPLLLELAQRCPWAALGYSEALKKEWKVNRSGFIERIDAQRKRISSPTFSPQS